MPLIVPGRPLGGRSGAITTAFYEQYSGKA
jgi:hypothetical protein